MLGPSGSDLLECRGGRFEDDSKSRIGQKISRQGVLNKTADSFVVKPEHYYSNWPPPPQKTMAEITKLVNESGEKEWLDTLIETDEIFEYDDISCLAGSAGYVAFRDGKQISEYAVMVS